MPAYFESGVFNRGLKAWHGEGTVINDEDLTPEEAFRLSGADFAVVKKPLYFLHDGTPMLSTRSALVHGVSGQELGTCGSGYEVAQNSRLVDMLKAIQEQVIIDTFIVLDEGRKVVFTALIKDTSAEILPGDPTNAFFVGYLGHDGKTGIGGLYTDVRVVCANTLGVAMLSQNHRSLAHRPGVNKEIDHLIKSLDVARRRFKDDSEMFRHFANTKMSVDEYRAMLEHVYANELARPVKEDDRPVRTRRLEDLRSFTQLSTAFDYSTGSDIHGVRGTVWQGYNALTEVLTSPLNAQNGIKKLNRTWFGVDKGRIETARQFCKELCGIN